MSPSPPSSWQKFAEFKRNRGEWEKKKIHKEQSLQILRFIADFPILQSCQPAAVPEGDYLQKPHGLGHRASSDDVTRDSCAGACCLQNSWRQNPFFLILNSWQDLGSGIVWFNLPSASNKKTGDIQWGMLLFLSSVPCARRVVLRGSHRAESRAISMRQCGFSSTTSIRNSLSCALRQRLLTILPTMLLSYQHY